MDPDYRTWLRVLTGHNETERRLLLRRHPRPLPPVRPGPAPRSDDLARALTFVIEHFLLAHSWRRIGEAHQYHYTTVIKAASRFTELLPSSWVDVFGGGNAGKRLDVLLPIETIRRARQA